MFCKWEHLNTPQPYTAQWISENLTYQKQNSYVKPHWWVQRAVEIYNITVKIMLITIAKIKHNRDSLIYKPKRISMARRLCLLNIFSTMLPTRQMARGEGGRGREGWSYWSREGLLYSHARYNWCRYIYIHWYRWFTERGVYLEKIQCYKTGRKKVPLKVWRHLILVFWYLLFILYYLKLIKLIIIIY